MMAAVPYVEPPVDRGPHHPSCCWHRDNPVMTLDEDGTIACAHGEAPEGDKQWMARRNEFVCKLLMEVLAGWDCRGLAVIFGHIGRPNPNMWYEPLSGIETDWCDTCMLPSRLSVHAAMFIGYHLHAVTTFTFCRNCGTG